MLSITLTSTSNHSGETKYSIRSYYVPETDLCCLKALKFHPHNCV